MCAKFVASTLSTTTDELCWRETKQSIQYAFENALKTLDDLGREAKRWEQARLVDALCSMAKGQYWSAAARIFEVANAIQDGPARRGSPPEVSCHQRSDAPGSHPHSHPLLDVDCP
jgi:hypothetical protein